MIKQLTSIIINTRNGHQTINRAIRSALDQSFNNIEIIVYDNASNPPINSVIEVVSNKLEIVRCNEVLNLGEARNRAFSASSGEYIVFLDDDDIMLPNKIDMCINAIETDSNVGMVYTNVYVYHQEAKRSYLEYNSEMPAGNIYNLLFKGNYILWQSTFFRRESMISNEDPFPSKFNNVFNARDSYSKSDSSNKKSSLKEFLATNNECMLPVSEYRGLCTNSKLGIFF